MVGHQHESAARGELDHLAAVRHAVGQRLLDQHVLAGPQRRAARSAWWVRAGVAIAIASMSSRASTSSRDAVTSTPLRSPSTSSARAVSRSHTATRSQSPAAPEVADQVRAPVAGAHDGHPEALKTSSLSSQQVVLSSCRAIAVGWERRTTGPPGLYPQLGTARAVRSAQVPASLRAGPEDDVDEVVGAVPGAGREPASGAVHVAPVACGRHRQRPWCTRRRRRLGVTA